MDRLEVEANRLQELRTRHAAVTASIAKSREVIAKCIREAGEARVATTLDPEAHPAKETESICKKLDVQRTAAQAEIDKLSPEADAIVAAIRRIESEILPLRHEARLERQKTVREEYRAICEQILETVNTLAELNLRARAAFDSAEREFRRDELQPGRDVVMRFAGLRPVHDGAWLSFPGQPSRRDFFVERLYDFDRTLIPEGDPIAISRQHQEAHRRKEFERHNAEQRARAATLTGPAAAPKEEFRPATLTEFQTGEWVPDEERGVYHPLSRIGKALNLGLIKRAS